MCHTKTIQFIFLRHNQIEACCFILCTNKTLYEAFSIRYSGGMRTIRMRPKHIERSKELSVLLNEVVVTGTGTEHYLKDAPVQTEGNHWQSP